MSGSYTHEALGAVPPKQVLAQWSPTFHSTLIISSRCTAAAAAAGLLQALNSTVSSNSSSNRFGISASDK